MDTKAELVRTTFDRIAPLYDDSPFFPRCGERLAELASIEPGAQVLDVATGTGAVLVPIARRLGHTGRVIGIDVAPGMLARSKERIRAAGISNAEVRLMDAQKLEFPDESFDRITCGFVLWFIPDLATALSEMRRVLGPHGRLAVSTWAADGLLQAYFRLLARYRNPFPALGSHNLTTAALVTDVLDAAGFDIEFAADEEVTVVSPDKDMWWSRRDSNPHLYASELSPGDHERFKADVYDMLDSFSGPEGISHKRGVVYAVAKPRRQFG